MTKAEYRRRQQWRQLAFSDAQHERRVKQFLANPPKRKKKRVAKHLKQLICKQFMANLSELRRAADHYGLVLVVHNIARDEHRPSLHVMVNDSGGWRVLDYWPATGTWINPKGERGVTSNVGELLEMASVLT